MYNEQGCKAAGTAAHCSQVVWVSKIRGFIIPNSRSWLYAEWCFCIILLHMLFLQWWWYLCFCQACRNGSIVSFPSISSFLSIAFPKFLNIKKLWQFGYRTLSDQKNGISTRLSWFKFSYYLPSMMFKNSNTIFHFDNSLHWRRILLTRKEAGRGIYEADQVAA